MIFRHRRLFLGLSGLFLLICGIASKASMAENTENAYQYFEHRLTYEVSSRTVNGWMQSNEPHEDFIIIDVREEKDYLAGHVPGAINMPCSKYNSFSGPETEFPELKKEGTLYIVICYGGDCDKSHAAAKKLASLGYPVKKLMGGFSHWEKQGYPIET